MLKKGAFFDLKNTSLIGFRKGFLPKMAFFGVFRTSGGPPGGGPKTPIFDPFLGLFFKAYFLNPKIMPKKRGIFCNF